MGAVFHERHEADLGECAPAPAGARAAERPIIRFGVGNVKGTAIEADKAPVPIERSLGISHGNGLDQLVVKTPNRLDPQSRTRATDPRLARNRDTATGETQPLQSFEEAPQYLSP